MVQVKNGADRLPAARAVPSPVRRHAEHAADDGIPDHQGISRLRHPPRLSRPAVRRDAASGHPGEAARARPWRRSSTARSMATTLTGMAGVANIGTDRNWSGSLFNQANWYAFGRMAWDPDAARPDAIADEWVRHDLLERPRVVEPVTDMMMGSREAVVDYMTPLGLHHLMATGHHYGPAPWVAEAAARRMEPGLLPPRRRQRHREHRRSPCGLRHDTAHRRARPPADRLHHRQSGPDRQRAAPGRVPRRRCAAVGIPYAGRAVTQGLFTYRSGLDMGPNSLLRSRAPAFRRSSRAMTIWRRQPSRSRTGMGWTCRTT